MKVKDTDNFKEELGNLLDEIATSLKDKFINDVMAEYNESLAKFQDMDYNEIAEAIAREMADTHLEDEYAIYKAEFYGNFTREGYEEKIPMSNEFQDKVGYGIIRVPYDMMMRAILNHIGIEHEQIEEIKYDSDRNVTIISYIE